MNERTVMRAGEWLARYQVQVQGADRYKTDPDILSLYGVALVDNGPSNVKQLETAVEVLCVVAKGSARLTLQLARRQGPAAADDGQRDESPYPSCPCATNPRQATAGQRMVRASILRALASILRALIVAGRASPGASSEPGATFRPGRIGPRSPCCADSFTASTATAASIWQKVRA